MTTLYSLRTDGSSFRITKFVDGEPEGSYITSERECECPAGQRPSCRHRQMLPQMLAHGIANTHWFMDWDRSGSIVDFNGASKRLYDELAAAAEIGNIEPCATPEQAQEAMAECDYWNGRKSLGAVGEAQHVEEDTSRVEMPKTPLPATSWRRL